MGTMSISLQWYVPSESCGAFSIWNSIFVVVFFSGQFQSYNKQVSDDLQFQFSLLQACKLAGDGKAEAVSSAAAGGISLYKSLQKFFGRDVQLLAGGIFNTEPNVIFLVTGIYIYSCAGQGVFYHITVQVL